MGCKKCSNDMQSHLHLWRFNISKPYCQWQELVGNWNWFNFDFIHIGVEHTPEIKMTELHLAVLGFYINIDYRKEVDK